MLWAGKCAAYFSVFSQLGLEFTFSTRRNIKQGNLCKGKTEIEIGGLFFSNLIETKEMRGLLHQPLSSGVIEKQKQEWD